MVEVEADPRPGATTVAALAVAHQTAATQAQVVVATTTAAAAVLVPTGAMEAPLAAAEAVAVAVRAVAARAAVAAVVAGVVVVVVVVVPAMAQPPAMTTTNGSATKRPTQPVALARVATRWEAVVVVMAAVPLPAAMSLQPRLQLASLPRSVATTTETTCMRQPLASMAASAPVMQPRRQRVRSPTRRACAPLASATRRRRARTRCLWTLSWTTTTRTS